MREWEVSLSDVLDWICHEVETRLVNGRAPDECVRDVSALVAEMGRIEDVWRARGPWVVSNIYATFLRQKRQEAALAGTQPYIPRADVLVADTVLPESEPVSAGVTDDTLPRFGGRRYEPASLKNAIYYAQIRVGDRLIRYGEMMSADWLSKAEQYRVSADNATARYWAARKIAERIPYGKTTEESLSPDELRGLIPIIGF